MANRTYVDDQGRKWDSKFEWRIVKWLEDRGISYDPQPRSFDYTTPVRSGQCLDCQGTRIAKKRVYTPDLHIHGTDFYVEAKGYMRADRRSQLQTFMRTRRDVPVRFVFQANRDLPLLRTPDYLTWADYYKCKALVWSDARGLEDWL